MERLREVLESFEREYAGLRASAEKAVAQLSTAEMRAARVPGGDSVATVMKHVAGNLRSRFTDFLDSDGEKPWRRRDDEFVDGWAAGEDGRAQAMEHWRAGFTCLESTLADLRDADLERVVLIRGEPHSVARALARSLAHTAWHCGQIVLMSRDLAGPRWRTLTIPRGGSDAHNRALMGDDGRSRGA